MMQEMLIFSGFQKNGHVPRDLHFRAINFEGSFLAGYCKFTHALNVEKVQFCCIFRMTYCMQASDFYMQQDMSGGIFKINCTETVRLFGRGLIYKYQEYHYKGIPA